MRDYKAAGSRNQYRTEREPRRLPAGLPQITLAGVALAAVGLLVWLFLGFGGESARTKEATVQTTSDGRPIIPLNLPPATTGAAASGATESPPETRGPEHAGSGS
jgi:hypothetical protein